MDLLWPGFLFLLGLIPIILAVYIWMLRRRRRFAVRYSSLALVREARPEQSWLRRHLPFALFLLALVSLVFALGRPVTIATVPTDQTTIILTMDVSGSMRSRDIPPSRLGAAEAAAFSFVQHQKSSTQFGIVAFSNFAELIQPPTNDQEALQTAIESLTTGRRTAIGSGILKAIDAIAEIDKSVPPSIDDTSTATEPAPVPHGAYAPDIIVLLTDGVSNSGIDPLDAAQQAADRGIRVYTIGFGTNNGFVPNDNQGQGGGQFGGNGGQFGGNGGGFGFGGGNGGFGYGGGFRTGIDDVVLKKIAAMTGGTYHAASSASELQSVFESLPTYLISKHQVTEISVVFVFFGAFLAAMSILLSMMWRPFP
jgi:Ca-activated chloride channel family protein